MAYFPFIMSLLGLLTGVLKLHLWIHLTLLDIFSEFSVLISFKQLHVFLYFPHSTYTSALFILLFLFFFLTERKGSKICYKVLSTFSHLLTVLFLPQTIDLSFLFLSMIYCLLTNVVSIFMYSTCLFGWYKKHCGRKCFASQGKML